VPVLIVDGEHDRLANTTLAKPDKPEINFSVRALYDAIAGSDKIMVTACVTGHHMPWEHQHKNLHYLSTQWIEHRQVDGKTTGRCIVDHNGTISPAP